MHLVIISIVFVMIHILVWNVLQDWSSFDYILSKLGESINYIPLLINYTFFLIIYYLPFFLFFFYFFGVFPVLLYSTFINSCFLSNDFYIVSAGFGFMCIFLFYSENILAFIKNKLFLIRGKDSIGSLKRHRLGVSSCFIFSRYDDLVALLNVVVVITFFLLSDLNFDFGSFYDSRFMARNKGWGYSYLLVTINNFTIPYFIYYSYRFKKYHYNFLALTLAFLLFLAAGIRNTFLIFFIINALAYMFFEDGESKETIINTIWIAVIYFLLLDLLSVGTLNGILEKTIRRCFFVPGFWSNLALDFSYDRLQPLSLSLGSEFITPGHNANLNPFVSSIKENGLGVSFVYLCVYSFVLSNFYSRKDTIVLTSWTSIIFSNMRFQSWVLSGSLLVMILYLAFREFSFND